MATESAFIYDESFTAASDLSAKQFYGVKFSADNTVDIITDEQDVVIGILQNKPKAGEAAVVRLLGMTKAQADGSGTAIVAGDPVGVNDAGILVKKATPDYTVLGTAVLGTAASGTLISVLLPAVGYGRFRTALDA